MAIITHSLCGTLHNVCCASSQRHPILLTRMSPCCTTPVYVPDTVQNILLSMWRKIVDHPVYSQDHSPFVFHLYGPLKKVLKGSRFRSETPRPNGAVVPAITWGVVISFISVH